MSSRRARIDIVKAVELLLLQHRFLSLTQGIDVRTQENETPVRLRQTPRSSRSRIAFRWA
jgi:hypothetical protein